ncbi:craniofacial development protein 2-like [Hemicordylus capensis]|uniref:craniofacial development protein 2-like n=1 Tax=Hemicordylus capensis TaxID=884348 RepID=UPI002303EB51|nr:craniofacial development protein 2-like [Hemicordylus capensis]
MVIRINGKFHNITILQIYAPTADSEEEEIEEFYAELLEARKQTSKKDIVYIVGNFNAKADEVEKSEMEILQVCPEKFLLWWTKKELRRRVWSM